MAIDRRALEEDFPQLAHHIHGAPLIYFDNAATTLKVRPVLEALEEHYRRDVSNVHRGIHHLSEKATYNYEESRRALAQFIGAKHPHEVVFTKGTTESINLVASSFGEKYLKEGDRILVSTMEHHSNLVPWQMVAQRWGAKVEAIPVTNGGDLDLEAYESLLGEEGVALVAIASISNALGTINPLEEVLALAHRAGSRTLVDAAQSVAHTRVDVGELAPDFLAFSGHKMFGPTGIGVLYGREELLEEMPPYQGGGGMIETVSFSQTAYGELPHRFEAGTPPIAQAIALKEAVDYIGRVGLGAIEERERELTAYLEEKITSVEGVSVVGHPLRRSAILAFVAQRGHPRDLATLLDLKGVAVRSGHHCAMPLVERMGHSAWARASLCFYNTEEEVDRFVEALESCLSLLQEEVGT